ncbi:hypothetical protein ACS0TY_035114 [Phlomoides rotata]
MRETKNGFVAGVSGESSRGREFVAGGLGGTAGVLAGHPLDTLRIQIQHSCKGSAFEILRRVVAKEGPCTLYRGMFAPLASISFQNAIVFQSTATLSRAFNTNPTKDEPPSYTSVALGGVGAGTMQSFLISPIELIKIHLQLQTNDDVRHKGPIDVARSIFKTQGLRGIYRGLWVTILRDAPSHGVYFWTYEYMKEQLHPGCRKSGQENFTTMLLAGGLSGVTSWLSCYPLDVVKTRIQAQSSSNLYYGIVDCFARSVAKEGLRVLWKGLGTTVARAFVVNGVVFTVYEMALRCIHSKNDC